MGATPARKHARNQPLHNEAEKIKSQIDRLISKMQNDEFFTPTRDELENCAVQINTLVMGYRTQVRPFETHLKAAIIDLTEVPVMHPQMQRISFLTALRDASKNVRLFLDCC